MDVKMGVLWTVWLTAVTAALGCELVPTGSDVSKSHGDNYYRLIVNGDVERYEPGQRYVVTLVGSRTHSVVQQFTRFKIALEPLDPSTTTPRLGQFQLFADTLTRFDEECATAVLEADDLPKTEVQAMWRAPPSGSGCVLLKAMVYENASSWFAEDGQLTRRVCEDTSRAAPDCCACDDAHYKMVFEGLWSARTHPKDFPTRALWLTHFSDVIGATHPANFSFWGEGLVATDGFRSLAEWGSVDLLERELRQVGGGGGGGVRLRTVFKAPGLWHPRVNRNTTAGFSVDRKRHLLSLASMFGPSPDWVVGVSGLDLCQKDCSWAESKVIDLLPYDAGTDNGISYMSPNSETIPREKMYRITPMYPEDPRAPFYNPGASAVPPLARLHLTRERLVSRSCDDALLQTQLTREEATTDVDKPECAVGEWSSFTACSVSCGKGLRMRTRQYRAPDKARMFNCDRQLVSKEMCVAPVPECEGDAEAETLDNPPASDASGICAVAEWSAWSECSVTCGVGVGTRRRYFTHPMGAKKCPLVQTEENRKCMQPQCTEEELAEQASVSDPACPTTEWAAWSPCSASCGAGVRFRTRLLLVPAERQQECSAKTELMQQRPCAERQDCTLDMPTAKRICMEAAEQGPCRGLYQRWAFVPLKGMCVPFNYGGCRGTRNNFLTRQDCMDTCKVILGGPPPSQGVPVPPAVSSNYPGLSVTSIVPIPNTISGSSAAQECQYSGWGEWSKCSVSCGLGYQARERTLLTGAGAGGAPCDKAVARRRRCYRRC